VGHARVRIFADDGTEASAGVVGQIYARQPASPDFTYVNNEDARLAMEKSGLISVGDVGYLDDAGYLFISDRKSDMVISGGVNIYPAEVEAQLLTLSGVADCAVFGIPDDEYGEALAAVVQPELGSDLNDLQVRAHLQACLANFKVPRVIEFHAELPREDSGKIFKRLLREPYWRDRERSV
jgi:long-chain acyl-CoA synthetase